MMLHQQQLQQQMIMQQQQQQHLHQQQQHQKHIDNAGIVTVYQLSQDHLMSGMTSPTKLGQSQHHTLRTFSPHHHQQQSPHQHYHHQHQNAYTPSPPLPLTYDDQLAESHYSTLQQLDSSVDDFDDASHNASSVAPSRSLSPLSVSLASAAAVAPELPARNGYATTASRHHQY